MIQKKICMVGAFAVGKTSLVKRYVHSLFSDKYLSTVGVKIDKKTVRAAGQDVMLMLWDLYGEDSVQKIQLNYVKGAAGFLIVVDGTRASTLSTGLELCRTVQGVTGPIPHLIVLNKSDLRADWEVPPQAIEELRARGESVILASAKTGEGVEAAFIGLSERMLKAGA